MTNLRQKSLRATIDIPPSRFDKRLLPENYTPSEMDILCGRGRAFASHHGNKIFAYAIRAKLQRYVEAPKRIDKSVIASSLVSSLRENGAHFVKQDKKSKRYYELSDDQAHEKIGHAFRDVLKGLDSSNPKKTDCGRPLPKFLVSLNEKPGTVASLSQKEPVVPRGLHEAKNDSAVPLQHDSVIPFTVLEVSSSECWFSRDEPLDFPDISPSLFCLDGNEEITAFETPDLLPTLADLLDEFEQEQDVDRPFPLSSETTFEFQDMRRMYKILSQDVCS
jgi:hypothetical protein